MAKNKFAEAIKKKQQSEADRIKELEQMLERQAEQFERMQKAKWSIPQAPKRVSGGSYLRLIVPDTHGSHADPAAIAAMLDDIKQIGTDAIREVIMLGDHLDCGGFLAAHHTLGYVAETEMSFEEDVNATNVLLDKLQELMPKAKIEYIEGNHEHRIEKWCVTMAIGNPKNARHLLKCFGVENQLRLNDRGINLYKQGVKYDDIPIPSTIRRGKCFFTHGERCGKAAAAKTLNDFGGCVVFGHVHCEGSASDTKVHAGSIAAYTPGCLCVKQPLWAHTRPTGWTQGYAVHNVLKCGRFQHFPIGILEKEKHSTFASFLRKINH